MCRSGLLSSELNIAETSRYQTGSGSGIRNSDLRLACTDDLFMPILLDVEFTRTAREDFHGAQERWQNAGPTSRSRELSIKKRNRCRALTGSRLQTRIPRSAAALVALESTAAWEVLPSETGIVSISIECHSNRASAGAKAVNQLNVFTGFPSAVPKPLNGCSCCKGARTHGLQHRCE